LDSLQSLLDKSLLYQVEDPHGELRFMMLETIREYALERLGASGEATALRRAHAAFFLPLVETVAHSPWGTDTTVGFGQLEREHDNLHAVLHWALEQQHSELALRLASGLVYFWEAQGYLSEG